MIRRFFSSLFGSQSNREAQAAARARQRVEQRMKAIADSPFEIVETTGENALAKWEELKRAGRGVPVVLGHENVESILNPFHRTPVSEALAAADAIKFPEDFFIMRRDEGAAALAYLRKTNPSLEFEDEEHDARLSEGEWPAEASRSPGLSIAYDLRSGEPLPKVYIVLVPTEDPTTVPAHLHFGNWNSCPAPEYHIAALRHWRDRYGAELVGLEGDTMNIRVSRKPATRDEAVELAKVQYAYCNDIIDQGVGSYPALAAELMAHDWWFFWWD
jgi:hypothetical protein